MNNNLKIKFVNQNFDGMESWFGNDKLFWIRLDFFLEYFISGNLELSEKYKNKKISLEEYSTDLFKKFNDKTYASEKFDHIKYNEWLDMKNPEIKKIVRLFNNKTSSE